MTRSTARKEMTASVEEQAMTRYGVVREMIPSVEEEAMTTCTGNKETIH